MPAIRSVLSLPGRNVGTRGNAFVERFVVTCFSGSGSVKNAGPHECGHYEGGHDERDHYKRGHDEPEGLRSPWPWRA